MVRRQAAQRAARHRRGEDRRAQQRALLFVAHAGERHLRAVGREVVLARGLHPLEPGDRFGREIAQAGSVGRNHEQVRDLAGRQPHVPEAIHPALGDVSFDGILGAALQLGLGGLGTPVISDHRCGEHDPRAVRQPLGIERAQRQIGEALRFSSLEWQHVDLPLAILALAHEREAFAVGRERRLRAGSFRRGERAWLTVRRHEPDARAAAILLHLVGGHGHRERVAIGRRERRAHTRNRPDV